MTLIFKFSGHYNNKARFMIFFFINILNVQISIFFFRVICFSLKFSLSSLQKINSQFFLLMLFFTIFLGTFLEVLKHLIKKFSQKNFLKFIFTHFVLIGWNLVNPPSLSHTKIQFLHKFIYFYFLMFSNFGCS